MTSLASPSVAPRAGPAPAAAASLGLAAVGETVADARPTALQLLQGQQLVASPLARARPRLELDAPPKSRAGAVHALAALVAHQVALPNKIGVDKPTSEQMHLSTPVQGPQMAPMLLLAPADAPPMVLAPAAIDDGCARVVRRKVPRKSAHPYRSAMQHCSAIPTVFGVLSFCANEIDEEPEPASSAPLPKHPRRQQLDFGVAPAAAALPFRLAARQDSDSEDDDDGHSHVRGQSMEEDAAATLSSGKSAARSARRSRPPARFQPAAGAAALAAAMEDDEDSSSGVGASAAAAADPAAEAARAARRSNKSSGVANFYADGRRKVCASCHTRNTPYWRDGWDGVCLCNACGIRYKKRRVACTACCYVPRKEERAHGACPRCGGTLFE